MWQKPNEKKAIDRFLESVGDAEIERFKTDIARSNEGVPQYFPTQGEETPKVIRGQRTVSPDTVLPMLLISSVTNTARHTAVRGLVLVGPGDIDALMYQMSKDYPEVPTDEWIILTPDNIAAFYKEMQRLVSELEKQYGVGYLDRLGLGLNSEL